MNKFEKYHKYFHGDTYDACARCEGKCEKYKISTLLPGEKEFMASRIGIKIEVFESKYLSRLETPMGPVDVLKMKDGCPFLDNEYRCTVVEMKPILCDSYPIVFAVEGSEVRFEIDRSGDCPMVTWPEYRHVIRDFEDKGIPALKRLRVPQHFLQILYLFDAFDFDYVRIEKEMGRSQGYETFFLEELLGFACNGYEKRARKTGLKCLQQRIRKTTQQGVETLGEALKGLRGPARQIGLSYKAYLREQESMIRRSLQAASRDAELLSYPAATAYLKVVADVLGVCSKLTREAERLLIRLQETTKSFASGKKPPGDLIPSRKIGEIGPAGSASGAAAPLWTYDVLDERSSDFLEGYCLLARNFATDEIDSLTTDAQLIQRCRMDGGVIAGVPGKGSAERIWFRWIMVVARGAAGSIDAAGDGALIVGPAGNTFYASHIATRGDLRGGGIGGRFFESMFRVAEERVAEGERALGLPAKARSQNRGRLHSIVTEVEFPDSGPAGESSLRRLTFHGRNGMKAVWPACYAQPDTNYLHKSFNPSLWNSVPMFLAYRFFSRGSDNPRQALLAARLLFDFFACTMGEGADWDRRHFDRCIASTPQPSLIPFPTCREDIPGFIEKTGWLSDILIKYYPLHRYTLDRSGKSFANS
jgi:Fe-S-cluster containining protein